MSPGIRYRLLTILLLGVFTSALSVMALVQLLSTSTSQRIERGRDAVLDEVERLAKGPPDARVASTTTFVGLRAGIARSDEAMPSLPEGWADVVAATVDESRGAGGPVVREAPVAGGTLVLAARPLAADAAGAPPPDARAWAGFLVRPLASLRAWQRIVSLLVAATVLLVATTLYSVVTMNRSAAALRASLEALATDLHAPIPRSSVRELSDIADGIAKLVERLAASRENEARMGRELAQNERLAALGRVAAGVAHEVRNPLASIKLRLDLAAATNALPASAEEAVVHAVGEIDRLDRLVADLLVVAGRATGPKRPTDVGALLRRRVEVLAPWAATRHIALRASGDALAVVDADSVARAIDNLLRNAIEASPPASAGGADARDLTVLEAVVEATVVEAADHVVLRVNDRGPGVPASRVPELFEPFFTTKPGGTGLGLALARAIARAHGGDVTYGRSGETTSFELRLPRGAGAARGEAA